MMPRRLTNSWNRIFAGVTLTLFSSLHTGCLTHETRGLDPTIVALILFSQAPPACVSALMGGSSSACTLNLAGIVTTLVGPAQGATGSGDTDATGNAARFNNLAHLTSDGTNLYVADQTNNKIRKVVIATGVVTTLAGPAQGATTSGDTDATGNAARFNNPFGITTDGTNLYVADMNNNKIRKIVIATGAVTTLAGPAQGTTTSGDTDNTGNAARFSAPAALATDGTNLYVADYSNNKIRKVVISSGVVTTFAGPAQGSSATGDTDATANAARFNQPAGLTSDGSNLYVADFANNKIRKIVLSTAAVTTIAGPAQGTTTPGDTDGTSNGARFSQPFGITTDTTALYVSDAANNKIRKIVIATGVVTTLAGPAEGATTSGDTDATGNAARFNQPYGLTTDGASLYVMDRINYRIRRIR